MNKLKGSATRVIKERLNILELVRRYVDLRRVGNRWVAPCPFHQETKPSFSVNEEEGFFYCFGCQAAGDIFDFHSRINGVDFRESLEQLAAEAGVSLDEDRPAAHAGGNEARRLAGEMYEVAAKHFRRNLFSRSGNEARAYLGKRLVSEAISEKFFLGWSLPEWKDLGNALRGAGFSPKQGAEAGLLKDNERGSVYDVFRGRIIFPVKNMSGKVIAFGGRIIDDSDAAKYINSADSPLYKKGDNLYGLFQARRGISAKKSAILTEGYMDVLTLHQFGYENACAALGTALTVEQLRRLSGLSSDLEFIFDGDAPGRKAALNACRMALGRGLNCKVIILPDGEDIDSLLHGQGRDAFEKLRGYAPEGLDFCIRSLSRSAPREALAWVKNFLGAVEHPELVAGYASRLCRGLDLDERELRKNLPAAQKEGFTASAGKGASLLKSGPRVLGKEILDRRIMSFVARFPKHLPALREAGVMLLLSGDWALSIWEKTADCAPDFDPDEVLRSLDDKEKDFWLRQRHMEAPPSETEFTELADIRKKAAAFCREKQDKACRQALHREADKNAYDPVLLEALNEALLQKRKLGSNNG
ncbi:MAG: DNA primase [Desulfovibrio sp.]|nr:DNA primase [Desulfovibrio sp.]